MKILISDAFGATLPDRLAPFGEVFDDKDRLGEAEVLLIRSKTKVTRDYLTNAPNLKLVIRGGVGIDNIDTAACDERGIKWSNTPTASAIAVAELAFALMLALPNQLVRGHGGMVQGDWLKKQIKRTELHGKTLGLVGFGNIAREVAARAVGFGMNVQVYRKSGREPDMAGVTLAASLDDLLAAADYLSLHTPATDDTRGMINAAAIAKMKPGARIINTARAACVDEQAVADALASGQLAGYGNDVWQSDPPETSPLLSAPNVVLMPHVGGSTAENMGRIGDEVVRLLTEFSA